MSTNGSVDDNEADPEPGVIARAGEPGAREDATRQRDAHAPLDGGALDDLPGDSEVPETEAQRLMRLAAAEEHQDRPSRGPMHGKL